MNDFSRSDDDTQLDQDQASEQAVDEARLRGFLSNIGAQLVNNFEDFSTDVDNRAIKPEGERPCPICNAVMTSKKEYGVTVDVCEDHGVWFDKGELQGVLKNFSISHDKVREFMVRAGHGKTAE